MKYICELCGWVYDEAAGEPRQGVAPGTVFSEVSGDFECPGCGYGKEAFDPVQAK